MPSFRVMGWQEDQKRLDRIEAALRAAATERPGFPATVDLPSLIQELEAWLTDERQWKYARAGGWKSLLKDVRQSLLAYPAPVLDHAGGVERLRDEIDLCISEISEEVQRETLLRRRLLRICAHLEDGLSSPEARFAAWDDLMARNERTSEARAASERLFALTSWAELDTASLLRAVEFTLGGERQRPLAPASHRLALAKEHVSRAPQRSTIAVWLRLLFAPIHAGTLSVGPRVTIYQAEWLAQRFDQADRSAPPDVLADDGWLRSLCQVDEILATPPGQRAKHLETPNALVRIEVPDATAAEALAPGRRDSCDATSSWTSALAPAWTLEVAPPAVGVCVG
jgi:hypothetical protein